MVISSDKIEKDIEAPQDGVLLEIAAEQDETVEVGKAIGYIGQEGEVINNITNDAVQEVATTILKEESLSSQTTIRVSPAARKLAREAGIDLSSISGSGPKGRITRADVEKAIQSKKHPPFRT